MGPRAPPPPGGRVSFSVAGRQRLGIVGESGSGKSLTALALIVLMLWFVAYVVATLGEHALWLKYRESEKT